MNLIKKIGRYELPLLSVITVKSRGGLLDRLLSLKLRPGYDARLSTGHVIHLTEAEKTILDQARAIHEETMKIYGMAKGLGLRT